MNIYKHTHILSVSSKKYEQISAHLPAAAFKIHPFLSASSQLTPASSAARM
jgi:hypothetical protein